LRATPPGYHVNSTPIAILGVYVYMLIITTILSTTLAIAG
jgi:hypothetical protein